MSALRKLAGTLGSAGLGAVLMALTVAAVLAGLLIQAGMTADSSFYRSPFFVGILAAMALNLFVHVVLRTRDLVSEMSSRRIPEVPKDAFSEELGIRKDPAAVSACVSLLARLGFKARSDEREGMRRLFAEKGSLWAWGPQFAHAGFLIILIGGAVSFAARNVERVMLKEGEVRNIQDGRFMLEADSAETQFWRRSGEARSYGIRLRIFKADLELASKRVSVNDPFEFENIRILQAGYKFAGELSSVRLKISGEGVKGRAVVDLKPREKLAMGNTGWRMAVEKFEPDFMIDPDGQTGSRSDEFRNPAALVVFYRGAKRAGEVWAFGPGVPAHKGTSPLKVELEDFDPVMENSLMVVRDPGEPFFRVGALLLLTGLAVSVFLSRKRIWIDLPVRAGEKGRIFGDPGRKVYHFEKDFNELTAILRSLT